MLWCRRMRHLHLPHLYQLMMQPNLITIRYHHVRAGSHSIKLSPASTEHPPFKDLIDRHYLCQDEAYRVALGQWYVFRTHSLDRLLDVNITRCLPKQKPYHEPDNLAYRYRLHTSRLVNSGAPFNLEVIIIDAATRSSSNNSGRRKILPCFGQCLL